MGARDAIVNDSLREIIISPWEQEMVQPASEKLKIVEINDDDYRSGMTPCEPLDRGFSKEQ